jgi:beta-lactamase regulating signal transducer with metallopeptidase domain
MDVTMKRPRRAHSSEPVSPATGQIATAQIATGPIASRPAALAAARVSRAGMLLGALGLAASIFVVLRLFAGWRVSSHSPPNQLSILGQRLTYPVANFGALVVLLLAAVGSIVTAMTLLGLLREIRAAGRFRRRLAEGERRLPNGATVIEDHRPRAFCAGLLRPRVYVSTGAIGLLDGLALDAVLAHERHHAQRRDPLRLAIGRVLARTLFFLPGIGELIRRQQALAELSADESAMHAAPENRSALARAMLTFSDAGGGGDSVGIDPARVDYLLGESPSWRFPALLCLAAVAVIALLVAVGVLVGQVAVGRATLDPPFLSSQPCVAVLAMIPCTLALIAARLSRRASRV